MINIEELKKYYPNLVGFDRNILREYLQFKILDLIFKSKLSNKLSFLGGTAIKICYGSARFSEDLDFDNFDLSQEEFNSLIDEAEKGLRYEGYKVEIKLVYKGAFRAYIRFPQILYNNKLSNYTDEKITIQVDTASHGFSYTPNDFILQNFDVFKNIKVTPPDIILSQKVAAIFGRKRAKGRDYFDLVYLLGITDFNFDYLDFKMGISNQAALKQKLLEHCEKINFAELLRDVEPFLIKPEDKERILSFKQYIEQKL